MKPKERVSNVRHDKDNILELGRIHLPICIWSEEGLEIPSICQEVWQMMRAAPAEKQSQFKLMLRELQPCQALR